MDWSLTCPMIDAHWGNAVLASKESGIVWSLKVVLSKSTGINPLSPGIIVPNILLTSAIVAFAKRVEISALQVIPGIALISAAIRPSSRGLSSPAYLYYYYK